MQPKIVFATTSDGVRISCATLGEGPPLVLAGVTFTSIDATLEEAAAETHRWAGGTYIAALASRAKVIMFDWRGVGASERDISHIDEATMALDLQAAVDRFDVQRFTLLGDGTGIPGALRFANYHPERVEKLLLWALQIDGSQTEGAAGMRRDWSMARRIWAGRIFPEGPVSAQRAFSDGVKAAVSAETSARYWELRDEIDLEGLLKGLTMPTLVMQRRRSEAARRELLAMASLIPDCETALFEGSAGSPTPGHDLVVAEIFRFLGVGESSDGVSSAASMRVILFADIASSTALTERHGDAAFRERSRAIDAAIREAVRTAGGTPVEGKVMGDGVMSTFASARQAIDAALRCQEASAQHELPLHLGIHAGDVISESDNVYGGAVNIAARICDASQPGEILVSEIVRGLARTSAGVTFADRGEHALKGIDEAQRLWAVLPAG